MFVLSRGFAALAGVVVAGPLVCATPVLAVDSAHDPTLVCDAYRNSGVLIYLTGVAQAPAGPDAPDSLTITCTVTNDAGHYMVSSTAPGYAVTTFGNGLLGAGALTVCGTAIAVYPGGEVGTASFARDGNKTPC